MAERELPRNERQVPTARIVAVLVPAVLLAIFALVNTDEVQVDFVVTDRRAPLIIVILVSAVLGAIIGFVARYLMRRRS